MKAQSKRTLRLETLECRRVLAASSFVPFPVITLDGNFQESIAVDIDADGDQDIIASTTERVLWFEAMDGEYVERVLPDAQFESSLLHAEDFDEDGDLDLFVSKTNEFRSPEWNEGRRSELLWFENTDGQGAFAEPRRLLSSTLTFIEEIHLVDLDADGFRDILVSSFFPGSGTLAWHRNDGTSQYTRHWLTGNFATALIPYDIDEDGDLDVFTSNSGGDVPAFSINWFERSPDNTFTRHRLPSSVAGEVLLVDLDLDGDPDALRKLVFRHNNGIGLRENLGAGSFSDLVMLVEVDARIQNFWTEDFDLDGRVDLLVKSRGSSFDLFPGLGDAQFGSPRPVIDDIDYDYDHFRPQDMDGDGDLDLFYMRGEQGEFGWIENRLAGDVNNDDQVSFADFLVLQERFGENVEAWSQGDLNGDGEVSFADFLLLAANFGEDRLA